MSSAPAPPLLAPFGDRAVRFVVPPGVPHRRLLAELSILPGVIDVVIAEEIGCVVLANGAVDPGAREAVERVLARTDLAGVEAPSATHAIRVVYDGDDLESVAQAIGRSAEEVVALHSGAEYRVAMLGFLPGFAYLRGLPEELHVPRRAPRPRVPSGSVAIAAEYSGVYPFASPGGWHLLGRAAEFDAFDVERGAALAIGDVVRFVPVSKDAMPEHRPPIVPSKAAPGGPHLEVTRAAAIALLVDGGRPGRMHEGVPPGGPLVRSLLARANASAGNAPDACAVEVTGTIEVTARGGSVIVADDASGLALRHAGGFRAAEHRAHPREQLPRIERLRNVVVGAELEPDDTVGVVPFGGQHHDRDLVIRADPPADLEPVDARQHHVEEDDVEGAAAERRKSGWTILDVNQVDVVRA